MVKLLRAILVALVLIAGAAADAAASHFSYATLSWVQDTTFVSDTHQRFTVTLDVGYQWSHPFDEGTNPPLGTTIGRVRVIYQSRVNGEVSGDPLVPVVVTSINEVEDWFVAVGSVTIEVPIGSAPIDVFHADCCRDDEMLEGNGETDYLIATVIDPALGTRSPRGIALPRITIPLGVASTFTIPTLAFDGLTNVVTITPSAESLMPDAIPGTGDEELSIDANGVVTWTPTTAGLYSFQVKITSFDAGGNERTFTTLELAIRVAEECIGTACNRPPVFTPAAIGPFIFQANQPNTFPVTAVDPDELDIVTIASAALPPGASLGPNTLPDGATATVNLSWTPNADQVGEHDVCFVAQDDRGGVSEGQYCATIFVVDNRPPTISCTPNLTIPATSISGAEVTLAVTTDEPDGDAMTLTWNVDGVDVATESAPPNGVLNGTLVRTYTIGSHTVTATVNDGSLSASCTTTVTVQKLPQTITFAPIGDRVYGSAPAGLIAMASSGLPVSFEVVAGPGTISGNALSFDAAGVIEVRALQPGDDLYDAAPPVPQFVTVAKAPLSIRADDKTRVQGAANPPLTATFTGFVLGDTSSVVSGLTLTTTAAAASAPGAYPIVAAGGTAANYEITHVNGVLTVTAIVDRACLEAAKVKVAKPGATIPFKIRPCGLACGPKLTLIAVSVSPAGSTVELPAPDAGNSNPGGVFRFTGAGYHFNLKTTGLRPGNYVLNYRVVGEAGLRQVPFTIRGSGDRKCYTHGAYHAGGRHHDDVVDRDHDDDDDENDRNRIKCHKDPHDDGGDDHDDDREKDDDRDDDEDDRDRKRRDGKDDDRRYYHKRY